MINKAIPEFDEFLASRGLFFEGTIIGGAALLVLGITERFTKDVDCLTPQIPEEIKKASEEFSEMKEELKIEKNWFNNGPSSLVNQLPQGWDKRLELIYDGKSLKLTTLGRPDLLKTKLFAFCDRTEPDLSDLQKLKPSIEELSESISWVKDCDGNEMWADHVEKMFLLLKETLNE